VSLSGDGCDELLAGYDTYIADRFQSLYARVPSWLHRGVVEPTSRLIPSSYRKVSLDFKLKQFIAFAHASPERAHFGWRSMFSPTECQALTGAGPEAAEGPFTRYAEHYAPVAGAPALEQALYVDLKTWLVDDSLAKLDRATMACGLEARVPFLGPRLVEFALALPTRLKLRGLQRKYILRRLMRERLPRAALRRRKRGFNAPVSHWLRGGLRADVDDLFAAGSSTLVDLRDPLVARLWREHSAGRVDHGFKLWTLLNLLLWERRVLA
jgi:asparagine synthase (glutamine-hydrolysing)